MSDRTPSRRTDAEGRADEELREAEGSLVRLEEELRVDTRSVEVGAVRARKRVENERFDEVFDREIEHADELDHVAANANDSGEIETLGDGSISIPVFEERLVVRKEVVVRERVILRKRTVTEQQRIEAELRKERVEIETTGDVGEPGRERER